MKFQIIRFFVLIFLLAIIAGSGTPAAAQDDDSDLNPAVETIFNALTPNERVGQLFIVSFAGSNVGAESEIAELVQTYHVGGVAISARNENFTNGQDTPAQVLNLSNSLQGLAQQNLPLQSSVDTAVTDTLSADSHNPVPLFVAVSHEGDGFPFSHIRAGLTSVPSAMALAATWDIENARQVGETVGHDLSLLGVNMLLGPSLDVLDNPRLNQGNALGVRTFGGSPYWVGEMGQAYVQGVHQGSSGRILTIAKHFPGFGSSDREINQGMPTILKSLDDLRRVELRPFFRVTDMQNNDTRGVVDGLMTAHARYQGLQGNVPISLDARNLPVLLALKEFTAWREAGGLIVSAPLGVPAALEGITASREIFPARRLVQDAFLAGHDILLLSDFAFVESEPEVHLANVTDAITFFQERYQNDPAFQDTVDRRVRRIIRAKIKIYGEELFNAQLQQPASQLEALGTVAIDLNRIAQAGVTLITPATQEGRNPLTNPPQPDENILIFVDDRTGQDCEACPPFPLIRTNALENAMLRFFGPNATGQLTSEQVNSLGFTDLKNVLSDETTEEQVEVEALIAEADWIIFAMLNIEPEGAPQSDAVKALLRSRFDSLRGKRLVLFAFNAPYFLDETEISQLTAYYGFYSKTEDYIEAAARLLFQQFEPGGASPVGIPAIGPLDLSPDPDQTIELIPIQIIDTNDNTTPIEQIPETGTVDLEVGEAILFRTGVIQDGNGHPVPNGTLVDFFRFYPQEGLSLEPLQSTTTDGVAEITIIKQRDTPLQVRASSNLAVRSVPFNIGPGIVDTPTPTPTSTASATPTPTSTASVTATPTASPVATATPESTATPVSVASVAPGPPARPVNLVDLAYAMLGSVLIAGIAFTLGGDRFPLEERVRSALVPIATGLVGYISYTILAMSFPNSDYVRSLVWQNSVGHWVAPLISVTFAVMGVMIWHLKPGRVFWRKSG